MTVVTGEEWSEQCIVLSLSCTAPPQSSQEEVVSSSSQPGQVNTASLLLSNQWSFLIRSQHCNVQHLPIHNQKMGPASYSDSFFFCIQREKDSIFFIRFVSLTCLIVEKICIYVKFYVLNFMFFLDLQTNANIQYSNRRILDYKNKTK